MSGRPGAGQRGGAGRGGGPRPWRRPGRGRGRPGGGRRGGPRGGGRRRGGRADGPSVRRLAAEAVRDVLEGMGAARTLLERIEREHTLDPRARGLLTELVYGVVRRVQTLDALLAPCVKRGLDALDDDVLAHLRVGAYQLLFLERIGAHVVVDAQVDAYGKPNARGLLNAVLRTLSRRIHARGDADAGDAPLPRRVIGRSSGWVVLTEDTLPAAFAPWLALSAGLPRVWVDDYVARLGEARALEVARGQAAPPPLYLRANPLRTTRDALLEELAGLGVNAAPGTLPESIVLSGTLGPAASVVAAGRATVQDETAMQVAHALDPQPGERIVDLCAAPGGKATHAAELMGDRGRVDALDVEADRVARLGAAVTRLGLSSVLPAQVDPACPTPPEGPPIDRVLADVPCSNSGVARRRVEVRHRVHALQLEPLLELQARLLERALELVRPGGVVVYSTCSIAHAENAAQVQQRLALDPSLTLVSEREAWPTVDGPDGGYCAVLRKA